MMGKLNFVINGVLRLPHGFRFHPTDEELVVQYLGRKVLAWPLPASIIPEVMITKQILGTCQVIWSKRGTSLAQEKPSIPMGTDLTEPRFQDIRKPQELTNKF
ncbi:hypothetical protein Gorai_017101 [Gossypium raimondii]|uniref:NAC domain-containing protein n=1 Tax=Gossypium raimondii TaxID=29730 RepID=A0A7J8PAY8_GOSRA|nr:hypothetical protein [Gossypium raimondii]